MFSCPRGSGKTSLLFHLQSDLEKQGYVVLYLDVEDVLSLSNFDYADFLAFLAVALVDGLTGKEGTSPIPGFVVPETQPILARIASAIFQTSDLKLKAGPAELSVKLKETLSTFQGYRDKVRNQASETLTDVNLLLSAAQGQAVVANKAGLVLLFDGLDRMDLEQQGSFFGHYDDLCSLKAHVIYTAHPSFVYSPHCRAWQVGTSTKLTAMPNLNLRPAESQEVSSQSDGYRLMLEMLEARAKAAGRKLAEIISPVAHDHLIRLSGGHARSLIGLFQRGLTFVEDLPITEEAMQIVQEEETINVMRTIPNEYWETLRKYEEPSRESSSDQVFQQSLYLNYILEYRNGHSWYEVNPVIRESEKFREAQPTG
jgi:hypothetical protein